METTTETRDAEDLADIGDLTKLLRVPDGHAGAEVALRIASERFRGATRRHITRVDEDEIVLDGDGSRVLLLPDAPVVQLREVVVDDHNIVAEVEVSAAAGILRRRACWPDRLGAVRVVYDHGYDDVPGDIQAAVLSQARVIFTAVPGLSSMTVGGQQVSFAASAAASVGTTQEWHDAVDAYRLRGDRA